MKLLGSETDFLCDNQTPIAARITDLRWKKLNIQLSDIQRGTGIYVLCVQSNNITLYTERKLNGGGTVGQG